MGRPLPEQFNLTAELAIEQARKTLKQHEGESRNQLQGLDADTAFDLGYASALYDIDRYRGDNSFSADLVMYDLPGEEVLDTDE